jgi:hypothetical protein
LSALSSPLSSIGTGSRSFRKLSGCYYECHSVLDPRTTLVVGGAMLPCADCDEVFVKAGSLEFHRSTRHAGKGKQLQLQLYILESFQANPLTDE